MEKDLMSVWDKPVTAMYYEKAMKDVYGKRIILAKKLYSRFKVLEDDLRDLGFDDYREYAYTIANALKRWCKDKGLEYIPYTVFCGEFAMGKYAKVKGMKTVDLATDKKQEELLYTELLVLRTFLLENLENVVVMPKVVNKLRPVLDSRWIDLYDNNGHRPTQEALEILAEEYKVKHCRIITDILLVAQLAHKQKMDMIAGRAWKHTHTMQISG